MQDLPIANVKFACDSPLGTACILNVCNATHMGDKMENSLLCPNQCRAAGVTIRDCPRIFDDDEQAQTISFSNNELIIPIKQLGPLPYFNARFPSNHELETCECVDLTCASSWDPCDNPQLETHEHILSFIITSYKP